MANGHLFYVAVQDWEIWIDENRMNLATKCSERVS
jgi:hypothetical protein